jgi:ribosome recycling factor
MPVDDILIDAEDRMEKAVKVLEERFSAFRTGRASATIVESVKVEYYGAATPLKGIATISVLGPQMIVIKPYDPSALKEIEKAILASEIGITPQNDGKLIRLAVPPLSEERRRQLASSAKELAEETKVSVRNIRRDANKGIDGEKNDKKSSVGEDEAFAAREEVQELTKKFEGAVDDLLERKTTEIMEI